MIAPPFYGCQGVAGKIQSPKSILRLKDKSSSNALMPKTITLAFKFYHLTLI
jgi:hypothetical protein